MIWTIYLVILIYFVLGFIGFYFINRKKEHVEARKSWLKYFTYFIIIHILFFSIAFFPALFRIICLIVIAGGLYEIIKVYIESGNNKQFVFYIALLIYSLLSIGFYVFSGYNRGLILFSFLIVSIFGSFSQIIGQIWGRKRLFKKISPQKTVEGFIGGILMAVASAWLLVGLLTGTDFIPMRLATGIVFFAFLGDMITSMYKRKYGVKDFSNLIPGHGGFLDRFDSLIAGGAFVAITVLFFNG